MQLAVLGGSSLLGGGGFFMKAALLGASVAGSMLLNGRKKPVGKLNDLRVSSASYGRGIPKLWGTMRVTGNMFWSTDFREEKVYLTQKGKAKTGGKGEKLEKKGKAQPVYKYYANFAMGLCEGPVDEVIRIWADNNLIYNKYNPDDDDLVSQGFSTREDGDNTGKSSQRSASGKKGSGGHSGRFVFRFYDGSEEQTPDPYMVDREGATKVPAYRGLAYLMFEDFALEDFGNRIPTITAEVTAKGETQQLVLRMENMPVPPEGWASTTGFDYPYILDIQRDLLYIGAKLASDGRPIIRVYDIVKRKEIERIDFIAEMPQTAPHGDTPATFTRTWTANEAKNFKVQGVTPNGDLVIYRMEGNYGVTLFFDPFSKKIVKSWGASGNILPNIWGGIFTQWGVNQLITQRTDMTKPYPDGMTGIFQRNGVMHVFDAEYNKVAQITSKEWKDQYFMGTPGTEQALYSISSNWGGTSQYRVYSSPLDVPAILNERVYISDKLLGAWPAVAGSKGSILILKYASYIVGAKCVGLIIDTGASFYGGDGTWVVKMDPINGKILWEKKIDVVSGFGVSQTNTFNHPPAWNNTNYTNLYSNGDLLRIDWRQEKIETEEGPNGSLVPVMNYPNYYWSERDAIVTVVADEDPATDLFQPVIVYQDRKIQSNVSLSQICQDVAKAAGVPEGSIITTGLETQEPLNGYMYEQPTEARSVLEELANCYQFDAVESDYQLIFKMRGGDSIATIPYEHLGVIDTDFGTDNERIAESIQYQAELPERVTISYFDPKKDYENGTQYFKRPTLPLPVVHTREQVEVTFNMALLNKYAKRMAKRLLYAAWSERTTVEFKLPRDYMRFDPSDTISLTLGDGRQIEVRLTDVTLGADATLDCVGVYNYPDSYKYLAETDPPLGVVPQDPVGVMDARPLIFNIPYIMDSHERPGDDFSYYWAAGARKSGFNYGLLQSMHDGSQWEIEGFTQLDAIWGVMRAIVPAPPAWNIEDTTTVIRLYPAFNFNEPSVVYSWESIPESEWPSEANMVIIGDEIILFKDVEEQPDGSVIISRLRRGYRGSIDAAYKHTSSDVWSIVHEGSIIQAHETLEYLNQSQVFLINTGVPYANIGGQRRGTLTGSTERPLPVGDVRRTNIAGGSVKFDWSRATRIGGALKSGTGTVPLAEEEEKYHLFVTSGPFDPITWNPDDPAKYIWKSSELTAPTVTIDSATLGTIGLTNTMDIHIVIHQMSNEVGYGFPHGLTKYYTMF